MLLAPHDMEDCDILILIGTPCRNLNDLEAEFTVLTGRAPIEGSELIKYPIFVKGELPADIEPYFEMETSADPDFRAFCRRRILADIHQAIGRLRAHRRLGDQLKVYILGDYPLDVPVTLVKASSITPDAATKIERVEMAIRAAVDQLKATGEKAIQAAVARITGYSQGYISRFSGLLQTLLSESNSVCNKSSAPPLDPDEGQWVSSEYLPTLANSPLTELLDGVLGVFGVYDKGEFQLIWDATPADTQIKILQALMFTLPAIQLKSLLLTVGVKM